MAEPSGELPSKRSRPTIAGLEVNVLVEAHVYAGLDGQGHAVHLLSAVEPSSAVVDLVPEAVVYDARTGDVLGKELVRRGRATEIEQMEGFGVYAEYGLRDCRGRRVAAKWLGDLRYDDEGNPYVRSRMVATQVNMFAREDVNASTPPLQAARLVVSLAASKTQRRGPRFVAVHDAHVAFFHADMDEWIAVIPPRGLRREGYGWQLYKAMYGTRRAGQLWQEFVAKIFNANGWIRITVCAGAHYEGEADMTTITHGDDFLTEGTWDAIDLLDRQLKNDIQIKCLGRCGPSADAWVKFLKRTISWRGDRFVGAADENIDGR